MRTDNIAFIDIEGYKNSREHRYGILLGNMQHKSYSASKVRNILVHTSGKLDLTNKKHKEVFDYANNQPKLYVFPEDSGSNSAQITVLPELIYEALISYRILLSKICKFNLNK